MDVASRIETLPERPNSLDEAYDLVVTWWRLVQELREQLGLTSQNSSLPPSQDRLSGKTKNRFRRPASRKKRGAQPGHIQHTRERVPEAEVDQVLRHFPNTRCPCGGDIVLDTEPEDRHQIFDLPEITDTVTEHPCFGGMCPDCRRTAVASLPKDVPTGQMGPGLIAWIALRSGHFRLSTRNIQALLQMQWGLTFSTGAISESQEPVAEWLAPLHEHLGETIRQAPVAHADETTHFQGAQRQWLWVLCTPQLAFFLVHAARGRKAAKELLGDFAGILITDRHGAYHAHPAAQRQLCWSHVIRNLERLSGRKGDPGELGLWRVRVARIVIRLEHRWRGSGYQSQHYRRRLLAARVTTKRHGNKAWPSMPVSAPAMPAWPC